MIIRTPGEVSVGIGDMKIARAPATSVVTHALGSCIGVFAWDPETKVGGCLHYMLPKSEGGTEPLKYADTGLPLLIRGVAPEAAIAKRLRIVACGGAQMNTDSAMFRIGQRNVAAVRQFMWQFGLVLAAHDFGGNSPRTARLDLRTGQVTVDSASRSTML